MGQQAGVVLAGRGGEGRGGRDRQVGGALSPGLLPPGGRTSGLLDVCTCDRLWRDREWCSVGVRLVRGMMRLVLGRSSMACGKLSSGLSECDARITALICRYGFDSPTACMEVSIAQEHQRVW